MGMVLLACYECGNDVSSAATSCPKCGAPFEFVSEETASPQGRMAPVAYAVPAEVSAVPVAARRMTGGKKGVTAFALLMMAYGCYELATGSISNLGLIALLIAFVAAWCVSPRAASSSSPSFLERAAGLHPKVVCKHCGTSGQVFVKRVERKRGISGGKATGALMTGGISLLATGLARKEAVAAMQCKHCGMKWDE